MRKALPTYFPGILLLVIAIVIGQLTYQDYGMGWDEPTERWPGVLNYEYAVHGNEELFKVQKDNHGAGFEMLLVPIEKAMNITELRDVYLMRHTVTHLFFLVAVFMGYLLIYKVYKNQLVACLGFLMLLLSPRIYGHSYSNGRDIPFLAVFLMTMVCSEAAFRKDKMPLFFILGLLCGYATSIRIMGVMLGSFLLFFMAIDLIGSIVRKDKPLKGVANILLFFVGFCTTLYLFWPYIWKAPLATFVESFSAMSHFDWEGYVLLNGKMHYSLKLPWYYFPEWFCITTPVLWVLAGVAGFLFIMVDLFKKPLLFFRNTTERNVILWVACFFAPVIAVIVLKSVIYDDWRHLYFVYPAFVMCALYPLSKILKPNFRKIVAAGYLIPVVSVLFFMIKNHPFQMVYFNSFVSHKENALLKNYELDYWGCAYMQAMQYIINTDSREHIRVANAGLVQPVANNVQMLPAGDRVRMDAVTIDANPDYIITNFRGHPQGYSYPNMVYSINVLNSPIVCVYKIH